MPSPDISSAGSVPCAHCGAAIPKDAPFGQCPRCVLGLARGLMPVQAADPGGELLNAGQIRRIGDYELLDEIARGGMGVVYRARQLSLGREVALKMILAGELATEESVQRFRNEAAAAARLDHPHIVPVYEIGEHETQHYFSMRLVPGRQNVATWAKSLALSPAERAVRIAAMLARAARAVAFAHERGVLHRDLKPSNILVDEKGEPQVTDFGLAKFVTEEESTLTLSAHVLGSPSYMAPEQADARHRDVTTLTDVYGLGAVLYELLAGRPPFTGASPLATARLVADAMPDPLTDAPRDLNTVCLKCLAKEPAQRYNSAQALAEDLERFVRGEPVRARPVTGLESLWRWGRRNPKIAALLTALALVLALGFAGVTWQWHRAERLREKEAHARAEQDKAVAHLRWMEIARQAGTDEAPVALAHVAAMLRDTPGRWQAAMLAMSVVDQKAFPVLTGPPVTPDANLATPPRLSPDGTSFAAAAEDNSVRIWDSATGRERTRIAIASPAAAIAISQGPAVLAIATQDGDITVRASPESPAAKLPRSDSSPVLELCFSGVGSHLAARSQGRLEVWKCDTPERPLILSLDDSISGCAVSGEGTRVLAWNAKRAVVWDTSTGRPLLDVKAATSFRRAALAADGDTVALIDGLFLARTWSVESGALRSSIESSLPALHFLALNADGRRLALAGLSNEISVYDTASGLKVSPPMRHLYETTSLTVSSDGRRIVSFGMDGRACLWDAESGRSMLSAIWLNTERRASVDVSRDGSAVLVLPETLRDCSPAISVWRASLTRPSQRKRIEGQRNFASNRISPDGRLGCLSLSPDYRAYVYELATGRAVLDAPLAGDCYAHLFSPDSRLYYALTSNGWLYGWSLDTGLPLWPPGQQPGLIRPAAISPDGTRIVAGHNDGHLRIYETATGRLARTLDHSGEIKSIRFAPDGSGRFVSASNDCIAHVWDLHTGAKLSTFTGHKQTIIAAAWSPDSTLVATASYDQTARVWYAATGQAAGAPMQHLAWLSHLEFSPDGRLLATACRDGAVRLGHPLTGELAAPPLVLPSTAHTVRFTRDGACLFVRDHLGFSFWDAEKAEPVTVHFPEPIGGGSGGDAEAKREYLSSDGYLVHLGASMTEGALWTVSQPRAPAPAWFPDLLENLALIRVDARGTPRVSAGDGIFKVIELIRSAPEDEPYAAWARRVLGLETLK